ncbi:MAG: CrcB family protein [Anaerosomatales bacterium]|nr:CrcB family protein [Anaerosomatales bacterium]MDT8433177.1 CrcB family protein [Anaerosomatales bacterium]
MTEHTRDILLIAAGGAAGAVARHSVGRLVGPSGEGGIPWHTLLVNVTGAFALGLLLVIASRHGWPGWWRPLLGVGLLGGYTTFSALSLEAANLMLRGSIATAALYLGLSGLAAITGALGGILFGRAVA